jgi:uncharacterized protein DUF2795
MNSTSSHQFNCTICGQGFEQKSRLQRHMDTSHPPSAPSAADIEKVLSGIQYPRTKENLVEYASQRYSIVGEELLDLIKSLPTRNYRDSAEVSIALGELKSGKAFRSAKQAEATEQPSKKGGKAASESVSAAAVAKALSGIDFPKTKDSLKEYAKKNISKVKVEDPKAILSIIEQIADREYNNMADVEKSIRNIL